MKKTAVQAAVILLMSLAVGTLYNAVAVRSIPLLGGVQRYEQNNESQSAEALPADYEVDMPEYIEIEEAYRLYSKEDVVFVDARSREEFELSRIKGAVLLCYEEFDDYYEKASKELSDRNAIVVYCGGEECDLSILLADELYFMGYNNVKIFHGGCDEWEKAGYPVERVEVEQ